MLRKNAEKILSVRIQLSESVRIRNLSIEVNKWIHSWGEYDLLGSEEKWFWRMGGYAGGNVVILYIFCEIFEWSSSQVFVEMREWFIEKEDGRNHEEHPDEIDSLTLATGERWYWSIQKHRTKFKNFYKLIIHSSFLNISPKQTRKKNIFFCRIHLEEGSFCEEGTDILLVEVSKPWLSCIVSICTMGVDNLPFWSVCESRSKREKSRLPWSRWPSEYTDISSRNIERESWENTSLSKILRNTFETNEWGFYGRHNESISTYSGSFGSGIELTTGMVGQRIELFPIPSWIQDAGTIKLVSPESQTTDGVSTFGRGKFPSVDALVRIGVTIASGVVGSGIIGSIHHTGALSRIDGEFGDTFLFFLLRSTTNPKTHPQRRRAPQIRERVNII